ncbi:MAG: 23S rRNA (adenine(2503)-C(2))-methyltransferase RlmN [Thiotrichales bacterium]|nr:23S rRNA (adenine(2503)-C(2))-methyltransferase RlmN [Thiotrichales bacterium]MBT3612894.1 23S rRNA (adenine(2503)-C(2))-methyltransferase RlmN [Thiotrichales bacterium]MBT3752335.1 23S rRNA (adenine(2503)-C(2))-methyltransferase RlmN [Thiotrichales bacterium]MBT3837087.1 23S rRNA (adenine(2503)-C(2))-methyltransferase RlmN [Thiotrichales bacterium]MBT4152506.1 23S rRNA (adenine(2503)-C(2))-methyltransferase RlmN [Thiotrichales bacterium]
MLLRQLPRRLNTSSVMTVSVHGQDSQSVNILGLNLREMELFFAEHGEKSFRASQLLKWIHQQGEVDFQKMTNISKSLRDKLSTIAKVELPEVIADRTSVDGTRKWLLKFEDGNSVEAVFIPTKGRGTLCISSQVGCSLNCSFCNTAQHGYSRNLTSAEIIAQLWMADRLLGREGPGSHQRVITNVVLMGMGEPLLNFDAVVSAMELMMEDFAYGLSRRRITLSTSGVVPMIDKLKDECQVSLAVSLHATNDELRDQLVPINKKYPLKELLDSCRRYVEGSPRKRVTIEYILLGGVNDSSADAQALVKLLKTVPSKVNLIPYNPFTDGEYKVPTMEAIDKFQEIVARSGITTVTRKTRGEDIDAACGQLAGKFKARTKRGLQ